MPYDLSRYLVIGITTRALFDLSRENGIFEMEGPDAYSAYQLAHEDDVLQPGVGFSLIKGILRLNELADGKRKTEVIIISRNNADTSLRVFHSIQHYGLDITRAAFTSGRSIVPYLQAFNVDLFLSANEEDVQRAIDANVPAGLVVESDACYHPENEEEIRIAFDGDAVLFSEESERVFQEQGLEAFWAHEKLNAEKPLPEGPFARFLKTISYLQQTFPPEVRSPIRTALVTARNGPAHERVVRTLRAWNVRVDEAFFLGGARKDKILQAFGAHIFFDDQDAHLHGASRYVPSVKVPLPTTAQEMPAETE